MSKKALKYRMILGRWGRADREAAKHAHRQTADRHRPIR